MKEAATPESAAAEERQLSVEREPEAAVAAVAQWAEAKAAQVEGAAAEQVVEGPGASRAGLLAGAMQAVLVALEGTIAAQHSQTKPPILAR
eukprot:3955853-Pleurochrysis_carterae.AAC.2